MMHFRKIINWNFIIWIPSYPDVRFTVILFFIILIFAIIFHLYTFIIPCWMVILRGGFLLTYSLKINRVKKYKENGLWIKKTLKVIWINKRYEGYYWWYYYVSVMDWNVEYLSDASNEWKIWCVSIWHINEIYKKYWFEFDEKETYKQEVLAECNRCIEEKKYESENEGFFKKLLLKWKLILIENQRNIIEKWYQPQYWEVNWHRITVWDTVDVYFDPNNPENYRVDIDFLFDK